MGTVFFILLFSMRSFLLFSLVLAGCMAAPNLRMTCNECVEEMHHLGRHMHEGAPFIAEYLKDNFCPTVQDVEECEEHLVRYYVHQLGAIVQHFFVDGALHVCQTAGTCDVVREYTCEECVEGLQWVEAYMEDPIMIAEFTLYLEQNMCMDDGCKQEVAKYFAPMHMMAMEKFMIPQEICNSEPVCTGETHPPHPTHPFI